MEYKPGDWIMFREPTDGKYYPGPYKIGENGRIDVLCPDKISCYIRQYKVPAADYVYKVIPSNKEWFELDV